CGRLPSAVHLSILRPPLVLSLLLFFARSAHPRHLHSFPTRRSSDLIFSLMSGLYGGMNPRMFCTRPDVVIPGLGSRLGASFDSRSEEHTSELQSREKLVCRLLLEKKKQTVTTMRRRRQECEWAEMSE